MTRLRRDERGATSFEYLMLLALLAFVCVLAWKNLIKESLDAVETKESSINQW